MDINLLKSELLAAQYIGLTIPQIVTIMQTKSILPSNGLNVRVTREQVRACFNASEFITLPAQNQNVVLAVLGSDEVYVEGTDAVLLATAFAGKTLTLGALVNLRTAAIAAAAKSPADVIGFGGLSATELSDWIIKARI